MTDFDLALCRSVTALTHWTMANKARRLARKAREHLESGADAMPEELLVQHEEDMAECRQQVHIMTSY